MNVNNFEENSVVDNESFKFTEENYSKIRKLISKYPEGKQRSAIIATLDLAQRQNNGYLTRAAMDEVAEILSLAPIRVYEIATFYTMFNLKPVGKNFIQICTTTPCWLRGSDEIVEACKKELEVSEREVTKDGKFSYIEVECLGACANAPVVQINDDYYEDLTAEAMTKIIDELREDKQVKIGSQTGRTCSAPIKK
ncbi:MAG: NADH-quinone oxidoreductase subunit NuoE [Alphaproteobacteria bacterium]